MGRDQDQLADKVVVETLENKLKVLNRQLGKNSVVFGGALGATHYAPVRIAFGHIPDLALEAGGDEYADLQPTPAELSHYRRPKGEGL